VAVPQTAFLDPRYISRVTAAPAAKIHQIILVPGPIAISIGAQLDFKPFSISRRIASDLVGLGLG
jgi:hypothetical protein